MSISTLDKQRSSHHFESREMCRERQRGKTYLIQKVEMKKGTEHVASAKASCEPKKNAEFLLEYQRLNQFLIHSPQSDSKIQPIDLIPREGT